MSPRGIGQVYGAAMSLTRSRWAAIGAAVAVTLGGGGLIGVSAASGDASSFTSVSQTRVLDTRGGAKVSNETIELQLAGDGKVAPADSTAVAINVTVTGSETKGYVSVFPCTATTDDRPDTSTLNFNPGVDLANSTVVEIGSTGKVCFYVKGITHLLADAQGYYTRASSGADGQDGAGGSADGSDCSTEIYAGTVWANYDARGEFVTYCISEDAGEVTTVAGSGARGTVDGAGEQAQFDFPVGGDFDADGNLYVADLYGHTIRKVTSEGVVTTLAGTAGTSGSDDGTGTDARFYYPKDVVVGADGNVYVANSTSIRKVTPDGVVTTFVTIETGAYGIDVDGAGNLYVLGGANVVKVTAQGVATTLAGGSEGFTDGTGTDARFRNPSGLAVDATGNLYVADTQNCVIRKVTADGVVTTLAGSGIAGFADGTGATAKFEYPSAVAIGIDGNIYVAESNGSIIRRVTPAGEVTTVAGLAGMQGDDDGVGPLARFSIPSGVAVAANGDLYVSDRNNNKIRKITLPSSP